MFNYRVINGRVHVAQAWMYTVVEISRFQNSTSSFNEEQIIMAFLAINCNLISSLTDLF